LAEARHSHSRIHQLTSTSPPLDKVVSQLDQFWLWAGLSTFLVDVQVDRFNVFWFGDDLTTQQPDPPT
jgi:hypothetical protein